MKLIVYIVYDHGVDMHVKFHQAVIHYRSYCLYSNDFFHPSHNLVSNGRNFMNLY